MIFRIEDWRKSGLEIADMVSSFTTSLALLASGKMNLMSKPV